jgi:hypothetical protein
MKKAISVSMQKGSVLATALIFLLLLSALSLASLEVSQLELHMSHNFSEQIQVFYATEAVLTEAEKKLIHGDSKDCEEKISVSLQPKDFNAFEKSSCLINYHGIPVYYLFTPLPGDVFISTNNGKIYQGAYYRISAWNKVSNGLPLILQSTYAMISQNQNPAKIIPEDVPVIKEGRLSWRQF